MSRSSTSGENRTRTPIVCRTSGWIRIFLLNRYRAAPKQNRPSLHQFSRARLMRISAHGAKLAAELAGAPFGAHEKGLHVMTLRRFLPLGVFIIALGQQQSLYAQGNNTPILTRARADATQSYL